MMNYKRSNDNVYKIGTVITARDNPCQRLIIVKYIHRSYYCAVEGEDLKIQQTYLEKDLLQPLMN